MKKSDLSFCPISPCQVESTLLSISRNIAAYVIFLFAGGNTKFPGFEKRLYQELTGLFDEKTPIKVKALPNRELLGWIGGAR